MRNGKEKSRPHRPRWVRDDAGGERRKGGSRRRRALQRQERRWRRKVAATKWKDAKQGREKQIPRYARDDAGGGATKEWPASEGGPFKGKSEDGDIKSPLQNGKMRDE